MLGAHPGNESEREHLAEVNPDEGWQEVMGERHLAEVDPDEGWQEVMGERYLAEVNPGGDG